MSRSVNTPGNLKGIIVLGERRLKETVVIAGTPEGKAKSAMFPSLTRAKYVSLYYEV
jgi:hypothetical protein